MFCSYGNTAPIVATHMRSIALSVHLFLTYILYCILRPSLYFLTFCHLNSYSTSQCHSTVSGPSASGNIDFSSQRVQW